VKEEEGMDSVWLEWSLLLLWNMMILLGDHGDTQFLFSILHCSCLGYLHNKRNTRGVSHYGLAIYIKKHLNAKEEL